MADSLDKAVADPSDDEAWHDLLFFGARYLQQPKRGDKRRKISSLLLKRLMVGGASLDDESNQLKVTCRRSPEASRAAAIFSKLEDGNISATIRILCSDDTPADFFAVNLEKLQDKHSPAQAGAQSPPNPADKPALQVSEEVVLHAIRSFPAGSAGGPDGIRPQHLVEHTQSQEAGTRILSFMTELVNRFFWSCMPSA